MKKVGMIGVGKMGLSHLAIANNLNNIEVSAFCDNSGPLVWVLEKNLKIKGFRDYKEMIREVPLDGVIISVPNSLHYEITTYCLDMNINVFVEKPLTGNTFQSKAVANQSEKSELFGQVGYMNRYNLSFQRTKELVQQGIIGDVIAYEIRGLGAVITKSNTKGWRNSYEAGGGCLFDYGAHVVDLALYFFGDRVTVEGAVLSRSFSNSVDDAIFSVLRHDDGKIGTIRAYWSDFSIRKMSNNIEIYGKKGKILANKNEIKLFLIEPRLDLNLRDGWNTVYVTDFDTHVQFYLRGEEYTLQLEAFANRLNDDSVQVLSSLRTAAWTDRVLNEIFQASGGPT